LADLEAFELRMVDVKRLVLAASLWAARNSADLVQASNVALLCQTEWES